MCNLKKMRFSANYLRNTDYISKIWILIVLDIAVDLERLAAVFIGYVLIS